MNRRRLTLVGALLGLAVVSCSPWGRTLVREGYWESAIALGVIRPEAYVGPHLWAVAVSPDGSRIAAGGMSRDVQLMDAETGAALPSPLRLDSWVMEVGWSEDGRWFGASSFLGEVTVIEEATGRTALALRTDDVSYTFAFHPSRPWVAIGSYDGTLRLADLEAGTVRWSTRASEAGLLFVTFLPDGSALAAAGEEGAVRFFEPASGAAGRVLPVHGAGVTAVAFSPAGRLMATGGDDAWVRLWDVASGALLQEAQPHRGWTNFSAFLPDGNRWVTVGTDDRVYVWSVGDAAPRAREGHPGGLMCVRPFPDGAAFVTSGKDGHVRIWDAGTLDVDRAFDVWGRTDPGGWRWPAP